MIKNKIIDFLTWKDVADIHSIANGISENIDSVSTCCMEMLENGIVKQASDNKYSLVINHKEGFAQWMTDCGEFKPNTVATYKYDFLHAIKKMRELHLIEDGFWALCDSKKINQIKMIEITNPEMTDYNNNRNSRNNCKSMFETYMRYLDSLNMKAAQMEIIGDEDYAGEDAQFSKSVDDMIDSPDLQVSYTPTPIQHQERKGRTVIKRDAKVSATALKEAGYMCELGNDHKLFIRKKKNINYTEPHHLIPTSYQYQISDENSLDNVANIISLCSHCHNLLHYGRYEDKIELLALLFEKRKALLETAGIAIDFEKLLNIYK
ncbi:MAG: HNH endonuclease [Clostridiaceae bacterium]|jgi:5-methylcytosine-specific restriction endonuclease McrA|nr:HNH endonuclease [Clostridiaceae bacterium]